MYVFNMLTCEIKYALITNDTNNKPEVIYITL